MIQGIANAAVTGSTYVLIAIGLTMIYGQLRILHIAHAAVFTLGGLIGWFVLQAGGNLWLGLLAAVFVCGLVGVGLFEGIYRFIKDRPPIVPLIASVGLYILAVNLFQELLFGPHKQAFRPEATLPGIGSPLSALYLTPEQVTVLVVTGVLILGLIAIFRWTKVGMQWRAIAADTPMANAVGIPVRWSISLNFFVGSALAGIGGILVGLYDGQVYATMGDVPSYKAFVVIVIGGLGNVRGTIVAGFLLALLETVFITNYGYLIPRDAIAFAIMILVLMFAPRGLFGGGKQ